MGYPTIDKFDIKFIQRTKENVNTFKGPNKFTHLINSLIGLIFIPVEFNKKGKRNYKIDFLNKYISDYHILKNIFVGKVTLIDEQGEQFSQLKFYRKDNNENEKTIRETKVGDLVCLFRNGIAHSNIVPVSEGTYWKGIIVKNYRNQKREKIDDYNFEVYLTQKELRLFAIFISDKYLENVD